MFHRVRPLTFAALTLIGLAALEGCGSEPTSSGTSTAPPPSTPTPQPSTTTPGSEFSGPASPKVAESMLDTPITTRATECPSAVALVPTECGYATVPADWAAPNGGTMEVWYAWIPAVSGTSTGLTIPLHGGPGVAWSDSFASLAPLIEGVPNHDLLVVDARGTGLSGVLACPAIDALDWIPDGALQRETVAACAAELGDRRSHYNTASTVLDIEAIRRALDAAHPSIIGFSYGTFAAQAYATLFPDVVESLVLDGVMSLDLDPWGREYTDAFDRILELRCARTTTCDAAAVEADVRKVAGRLAMTPISFGDDGRLLTEGTFAYVTLFALQTDFDRYVTAVTASANGDDSALVTLADDTTRLGGTPPGYSLALAPIVGCHDYSAPFDLAADPQTRRAEFERGLADLPTDAFGWFSKQGWVGSGWEQVDMCIDHPTLGTDPLLRLPANIDYPADIPVLLLNGDIDTQTPLELAKRAAAHWANSRLIVIDDAIHPTFPVSSCAREQALVFLREPTLPPAAACDGHRAEGAS